LLIGADPGPALEAVAGEGGLARLLREAPDLVRRAYVDELRAGAELVAALTDHTSPRALAPFGVAFRAAVLTGAAVDLARDAGRAAKSRALVAGVLELPSLPLDPDRVAEEHAAHTARLALAGPDVVLARGLASGVDARRARIAAVAAASAAGLPTWAVARAVGGGLTGEGESIGASARAARDAGAELLLCAIDDVDAGLDALERAASDAAPLPLGLVLAADPVDDPGRWADAAMRLASGGARALGPGLGATAAHTHALAARLGLAGSAPSGAARTTHP
jgi:5-methyltetrahydrofolate--homocysteine methyltransferase